MIKSFFVTHIIENCVTYPFLNSRVISITTYEVGVWGREYYIYY